MDIILTMIIIKPGKPKGWITIDLSSWPCNKKEMELPNPQPGHHWTPRILSGQKLKWYVTGSDKVR
jgi:hypothetical protein